MGFVNRTVKHFSAFLTLLLLSFLLVSSPSNPSTAASCNEIPPEIKTEPSHHDVIQRADYPYQVLRFKNIAPFFLNELRVPDQAVVSDRKRKIRKMMKRRRRRNKKSNSFNKGNGRPFYVMLPKGFVPPSGSSPCHNDNPDSSVARALTCGF